MTLTGLVVGGQFVPDAPFAMPEGAKVRIEVENVPTEGAVETGNDDLGPTLAEQLKAFLKHQVELPEDAARNHDHYLYGTPKVFRGAWLNHHEFL
jgi:hypothetical protein